MHKGTGLLTLIQYVNEFFPASSTVRVCPVYKDFTAVSIERFLRPTPTRSLFHESRIAGNAVDPGRELGIALQLIEGRFIPGS